MADPTTRIPGLPTGVPVQFPTTAYSADGAITLVAGGIAVLTKSSAGAYTLAAPAGDGCVLILVAGTAMAHVVTIATADAAGGASQNVGTFGGAVNDSTILVSYNSQWYVAGGARNVTWA
jgi:hypothetical protein